MMVVAWWSCPCGGASLAEPQPRDQEAAAMVRKCNRLWGWWLLPGASWPPRTFRALCCLTAALAFALGIVIGVLIPLYVIPLGSAPLRVANATERSAHRLLGRLLLQQNRTMPPRSNGVSFVFPPPSLPQYVAPPSVHRRGEEDSSEDSYDEDDLVRGIFWSPSVESALPRAFSAEEVESWRRQCRRSTVVKVEEGCGRMQNRFLTFSDGSRACCRYRQNLDQIQGEIFSFYLSRLLGLGNLAPSALDLVRPREPKWMPVRSHLSLAQWAEDRPVVLTQYIPELVPAYIPQPFRGPTRHLHPPDLSLLKLNASRDRELLVHLAQWSDLVVFDYLTANLDRMVNNLYNLQWNPAMMEAPAHNLAQDRRSGLLVFLDNESGLLHGYRLLEKYEHYHRVMLDALCVFRRDTVDAIKRLHQQKNVGELLKKSFQSAEPGFRDFLPVIPDKSVKILNHRIDRVHEQMSKCEALYGRR